jgi:tetratricopeptide (TPR) repeat protein
MLGSSRSLRSDYGLQESRWPICSGSRTELGAKGHVACILRCLFMFGLIASANPQSVLVSERSVQDTAAPPPNNLSLEIGNPIKRKLAGGKSHSYSIGLLPGQYVHVVAEQRGIDIVLKIFGPDGKELARMNRWQYQGSPESLSYVASVGGTYRLEIAAANRDDRFGFYELKLLERRPVVPNDEIAVAAQSAYFRGDELSLEGTPEALQDGIAKLDESLALWHRVGDKLFEATTLLYLGVDYYDTGDPQKALTFYTSALPLFRSVGDRSGEAATRDYIGVTHQSFGESERALGYFRDALALARSIGDKQFEGQILHDVGMAYYSLGEMQSALDFQRQALKVTQLYGDHVWEAHILHHIGEIYVWEGGFRGRGRYLATVDCATAIPNLSSSP